MRLLTFLFIVCVLLACLEKAIAGPGTSSKRKRDESSDEWIDWSLNLATKNQLPASLAKVNIEKANKSGAQGLKLPGKKGKTTNAARTMRRARKRTSKPNMWPSYYWAKIPMKDPKTNQKKDMWHCFLLPHEWLASLWQDPRAQSACMCANYAHAWACLSKASFLLDSMEMLCLYLALFERLAWNSSLSTCLPFIGKKECLSQS